MFGEKLIWACQLHRESSNSNCLFSQVICLPTVLKMFSFIYAESRKLSTNWVRRWWLLSSIFNLPFPLNLHRFQKFHFHHRPSRKFKVRSEERPKIPRQISQLLLVVPDTSFIHLESLFYVFWRKSIYKKMFSHLRPFFDLKKHSKFIH